MVWPPVILLARGGCKESSAGSDHNSSPSQTRKTPAEKKQVSATFWDGEIFTIFTPREGPRKVKLVQTWTNCRAGNTGPDKVPTELRPESPDSLLWFGEFPDLSLFLILA